MEGGKRERKKYNVGAEMRDTESNYDIENSLLVCVGGFSRSRPLVFCAVTFDHACVPQSKNKKKVFLACTDESFGLQR